MVGANDRGEMRDAEAHHVANVHVVGVAPSSLEGVDGDGARGERGRDESKGVTRSFRSFADPESEYTRPCVGVATFEDAFKLLKTLDGAFVSVDDVGLVLFHARVEDGGVVKEELPSRLLHVHHVPFLNHLYLGCGGSEDDDRNGQNGGHDERINRHVNFRRRD